jgi:hypothetical protein
MRRLIGSIHCRPVPAHSALDLPSGTGWQRGGLGIKKTEFKLGLGFLTHKTNTALSLQRCCNTAVARWYLIHITLNTCQVIKWNTS